MNYEKLIDLLNDGETIAIKSKNTGLPRSYFYQIFSGKCNITVRNLEKIASYFDVKMSYFFDEQCNMTPETKIIILEKELEYTNKLLTERERTIKAYELVLKKKKIIPY
jgi:transcriptional regulator with XRE-family HTH domain